MSALTLAETLGVDDGLPICLSEAWDKPPVIHEEEKRECLALLALLFKDRGITKKAAKIALSEWNHNPVLVESEITQAYSSDEKLTCTLIRSSSKWVSKRCETWCEFNRWRQKQNAGKLENIKQENIKQKFPKEKEELQPIIESESEIHAKALEILEHGYPIQFIADNCGRMVLGAEKAFKKLVCCVAVQGIGQSSGLHPKLNGESGSGKTWVVLTFAHHLPSEAVVKGSSSNLAAFYHNDGDQVFRILDDYQAGNETLDTIIKQTSSVFHQKYDHRTVKKQEAVIHHIGSEQTWAITSIDGSQDIQVLNRQIPINVDDSEKLTQDVNKRTIERYGRGEEQFPEDETIEVCREIWRILRADGLINVKIPFWQRIEWLEASNRRNPSIFMDLLIAHAAMNRCHRLTACLHQHPSV